MMNKYNDFSALKALKKELDRKDASGKDSFYFKAAPKFEAPQDSKYFWLNNAIYVCAPSFGAPGTITLDVWRVK